MNTVEMPARIAKLPRNKVGYPVPAFVETIDGEPDFRVMKAQFLLDAHRFALCWVCGQRRGRTATFVIGPMCGVNRVSAEPPSHYDCALYSALACPFLTRPNMVRRENNMPEARHVAGTMIERNPGAVALWTTRRYSTFNVPGGFLFDVGEPERVEWYAHGREATREEVEASIDSGVPVLRAECDKERTITQQRLAHKELDQQIERARTLLPA